MHSADCCRWNRKCPDRSFDRSVSNGGFVAIGFLDFGFFIEQRSTIASNGGARNAGWQWPRCLLHQCPRQRRDAIAAVTVAGGWRRNAMSNLAFEVGGGLSAPVDKNYITWGGNFTLGAGVNFNRQFAMLAEYQFINDKLPGKLIAETGANGGNAHIWSLTVAPVVSLMPRSSNDIYLTGGGGFYRKVTNFTDPNLAEYCNYYYCGLVQVNQVVGHFSSNQPGWNLGGGYQHRMGGMFNDSRMKLFVEARYLKIYTPAYSNQPNGLGATTVAADTVQVPINVGVRF